MFNPLFLVHRIWRKRIFLAAFFLAIPFATSVLAASSSSLKVSAQTQESFSRLSFDWTKAISYTLKTQKENNTVHLHFKKTPLPKRLPSASQLPDYVESLSAGQEGEDLIIILRLKPGAKVKKFEVKNGLLVDLLPPPISEIVPKTAKKTNDSKTKETLKEASVKKESKEAPLKKTPSVAPLRMRLVENREGHSEFVFGTSENTKLAVIQRGNILFMALTQEGAIEIPAKKKLEAHNVASVTQSSPVPGTLLIRASLFGPKRWPHTRHKGGRWYVWLEASPQLDVKTSRISPINSKSFQMSLGETSTLITLEDPLSGVPLTLIPTKSLDAGFEHKARLPIAQILPCSNGGALLHGYPSLEITPKGNQFIVTAPSEGENFFSSISDRALGEKALPLPTLLHLERFKEYWEPNTSLNKKETVKVSWYEKLRYLEREISLIQNPKEESRKRLELARFFILSLHAREAKGQLSLALALSPTLDQNPEFLALQAIAALLTNDYGRADESLSTLLKEHEELLPWQAILLLEQKNPSAAYTLFNASLKNIMEMPAPLKKHVLFKGMKAAIQAKKSLLPFSKGLENVPLSNFEKSQIALYQAHSLYQSETHRGKAIEIYEALSKTAPPPLNIEALLKWITSSNPLPKDALDRIDQVRFLWEEDELSFDLHTLRASLFEKENQWFEVLNSFEDALHYADVDQAAHLRERTQKIFMDQFVHNKNLTSLKALSFYERFRKFAPYRDPEKRYVLNDRLMDLLVNLDLLDQAFLIGRQNIKKFGDVQTQKAISIYLAFLLIENGKPEKAIEKLEKIQSETLNDEMQIQVNHLKAHAYQKLQKYEEIISLLENPTEFESKLLKLNAYWGLKDWGSATPLAQEILASLEEDTSRAADVRPKVEGTVSIEGHAESVVDLESKVMERIAKKASYPHQSKAQSLLSQRTLQSSLLSSLYLSGQKAEASSERGIPDSNKDLFMLLSSEASALKGSPKDMLRKNITQTLKRTSHFIETFEKELNALS